MAFNPLRGAAQGLAGRALKKVAGNIRGGLLGIAGKSSNLSDTAGLTQTKFSTKNYSFPLDVEGPPGTGNQGHYIIFYVNQQTNAKLQFGSAEKAEGAKNLAKGQAEHKIKVKQENRNAEKARIAKTENIISPAPELGGIGAASNDTQQRLELEAQTEKLRKVSTVQVKRPPTVRMDTAITLYMPPSVSVSYGANYTDTEIGAAAAVGAQAYQDIVSGGKGVLETANKSLKALGPEIGDGMIRKALGAIDMIPGLEGAMEVVEMQRGFIKAPRMELAFKGIPKRSFQYDFKMIPKSAAEAEEIQKIIRGFKLNMLPEMVEGKANRLTIPNTFDIQYMYNGADNQYLHKISTCVLETMSVVYGGDRYKTFEANNNGAPPVEVQITLAFKEMDLITREKANQGF
jgi:hypothetical protein